jgi:hypothetical protein
VVPHALTSAPDATDREGRPSGLFKMCSDFLLWSCECHRACRGVRARVMSGPVREGVTLSGPAERHRPMHGDVFGTVV